ncbi:Glycosyl hydrolase family 20, catalytic domain [Parafilimonas terrae]|uniref:Glycosyl hydrolase family 20, catalytic domain n=2 Tax=Parafilimonas terrae TaxID=1465490 RepID=A0A1I5R1B3_9BACT|nr:Glycosyl hydrolase family 20, catalytic domain [Parafilimonas terrae]
MLLLLPACFLLLSLNAQQSSPDSLLPVRGFCIAAPAPKDVDRFIKFINEELATRKVNTLILRIDYDYQYKSHPELADSNGLSKKDIDKLVAACRKHNIDLIPQVNLLGHQSWANKTGKLLAVYPEFDETPNVKMPEQYKWPNADNLYCKSYCPLHPGVHKIVFDIVDEICDAFQATSFHAGMDEVFYLGDKQCPRCGGRDKAELFANEVRLINDHLAQKNRRLWIWGDRLIDGKTTGIGGWEASYNNTYRAVDMIPKDVVICDWHYERADKTPVYFAMKGLNVITCPWNRPAVAVQQTNDMINFRKTATKEMQPHFYGMMQTVWNSAASFLDGFYNKTPGRDGSNNTDWKCFVDMYNIIDSL